MLLIVVLIAVALVFDFLNGLHDAANSIATIVSTRVLSPRYAVAWAAFFNFIAFPGVRPACRRHHRHRHRLAQHHRRPGDLRRADGRHRLERGHLAGGHPLLLLPRPDRRAGGRRAVPRAAGTRCVWSGLGKTVAAIVLSPAIGFVLALLLVLLVSWLSCKATPLVGRQALPPGAVRLRQRLFAWAMAATTPRRPWASSPPCCSRTAWRAANSMCRFWVVLACQAAMALGTLFGGWRIVRTMGSRITHLTPMQGVCAETAGAITLFMAHLSGHSGLHHPHHHRRHRRRGRGAARLGGALERGQGHRRGLGGDHAGRRPDRRGVLSARRRAAAGLTSIVNARAIWAVDG